MNDITRLQYRGDLMDEYRCWLLVPKNPGSYSSEFDAGKPVSATEARQLMRKSNRYWMDRIKSIVGLECPIKELPEKTVYLKCSFIAKVQYRDPRGLDVAKFRLKDDPGFGTDWGDKLTVHRVKESTVVRETDYKPKNQKL